MTKVKTILVCGSSGSGKTSLIRSFAGEIWEEKLPRTVGLDESAGSVTILPSSENVLDELRILLPSDGLEIKILEIGGKDCHLRSAPRGRPLDGILLCYDLCNRASFQKAAHLLLQHRADRHSNYDNSSVVACAESPAHLAVVLCGTMLDAAGAERPRTVTGHEALSFAQTNGIRHVLAASARTGEGVQEVFCHMAAAMLEAEEEAEAERVVAARGPPGEIHWGLPNPSKNCLGRALLTSPQGERPHEPPTHSPAQRLVEVIDSKGVASVARPLATCIERGLLHRAVHIWVCDPRSGGLLLRKYSRSSVKLPGRWGPSCHGEVLCYGSTGDAAQGPHTSEISVRAAARIMQEQLWANQPSTDSFEHWFSCTSNNSRIRELIDIYITTVSSIGELRITPGDEVEWVHFLDIFGEEAKESRNLFHIEEIYRTSMVQRMRVRIMHADAMSVPVGLIGGSPQSVTAAPSLAHGRHTLKQASLGHDDASSHNSISSQPC